MGMDEDSYEYSSSIDQDNSIINTTITETEKRVTSNIMSKYEKAHILGIRAMQISKNSPIFTDIGDLTDPLKIAMKELREGRVPFIVRRSLPDGKVERWSCGELVLPDEFDV